uniref:Uncharacterized protein n=1 Tax=Romanomermis culicivorax TaxID=13658 RepID=A0A915JHS8_ROMCU
MVKNNLKSVWLGTRHDGDNWRWLDQTPWDYTSWATGQPDLTLRCALQTNTGTWNTVDCFTTAGYICKAKLPSVSCDTNPCQNGGTCSTDSPSASSVCLCKPGYTDQYCSSIASCNTSPCQNGGYTGALCQTMVDFCQCNPCQNGGTCTPILNAYQCTCAVGFSGTTCSVLRDFCSSAPCQNGGSCFSSANSYMCTCLAGYSGTNCEQASNPCSSTPCPTCQSAGNSNYTCLCPSGYAGRYCENVADACQSNPCQNGGTCFNGPNTFICRCASGYGGPTCAASTGSLCSPNPCANNGSCTLLTSDQYVCRCLDGWIGSLCDIDTNECLRLLRALGVNKEQNCKDSGESSGLRNSFQRGRLADNAQIWSILLETQTANTPTLDIVFWLQFLART